MDFADKAYLKVAGFRDFRIADYTDFMDFADKTCAECVNVIDSRVIQ